MKAKSRSVFFILILSLSFFFSACYKNNDPVIELNGPWYFSTTGINGKYTTFSLNDFDVIKNTLPERTGNIYLKTYFSIPVELKFRSLKCYLGNIKIASEFFLNGNYLGNSGFFPPKIFSIGGRSTVYDIPYPLCKTDSLNEIILQIYVEGEGCMGTNPFISTPNKVLFTQKNFDFYNSKLHLIISWMMMIIGIMYIGVFYLRRMDKQYFSFAMMNIFSSLFMVSLCIGEYPLIYQNNFSYLLYQKLFRGVAAIISSYFAVSFIKDYLKHKESLSWKIFRSAFTIGPCFFILFSANMHDFFICLGVSYIAVAIQLVYECVVIILNLKKKAKKIIEMLIGFTPVLVSIIVSVILLYKGKNISIIIVMGWQLTIFIFLAMLIAFFVSQCNRVDFLNSNLEKLVQNRTEELSRANNSLEETNTHLKYEVERADKEIELASFVQQSFYNIKLPDFKNFEVVYYNKPMAGVSGDLYDFYFSKDTLEGFGLFDVSGHGISSGLVTMLVKNIINDEFYKGKKLAMNEVLYIINDRIITQKGNVENYLTGVLARIKGNDIEFVNAGHPNVIHYKSKENKLELIKRGSTNETGVIGIADFPVNFETVTVTAEKGDLFLLYTDGLVETMNRNREEFGLERLKRTFLKNSDLSIKEQIENIVDEAHTFANRAKITDDITLLIIKKK